MVRGAYVIDPSGRRPSPPPSIDSVSGSTHPNRIQAPMIQWAQHPGADDSMGAPTVSMGALVHRVNGLPATLRQTPRCSVAGTKLHPLTHLSVNGCRECVNGCAECVNGCKNLCQWARKSGGVTLRLWLLKMGVDDVFLYCTATHPPSTSHSVAPPSNNTH